MPQARSSGSRGSGSRSGSTRSSSGTSRSGTTRRSGGSGSSSRSTSPRGTRSGGTASSSRSSRSSGTSTRSSQTHAASATHDPRIEAVAQRVRKLNERIIEASKEAGETTLSSYERALKAIASTLERGPGSSDIEWVSNLATAQAKFIRDVTNSWTKAARDMLK